MFKTPHKTSLHHNQQQHSHQSTASRDHQLSSNLRSSVKAAKAPSTPTAASSSSFLGSSLRIPHLQNRVSTAAGGLASATASPLLQPKSLLQMGQQQQHEYFIHSSLYTIARISSLPLQSQQQQQQHTSQTVILDSASGFVAECKSAHIHVWNARNSIIPPSKLPMPLFERASALQVPPALACLVSGAASSVGLLAVNAAGLIRAWPSVEVAKQFEEVDAQLGLDVYPVFLSRVDVSAHHDHCSLIIYLFFFFFPYL